MIITYGGGFTLGSCLGYFFSLWDLVCLVLPRAALRVSKPSPSEADGDTRTIMINCNSSNSIINTDHQQHQHQHHHSHDRQPMAECVRKSRESTSQTQSKTSSQSAAKKNSLKLPACYTYVIMIILFILILIGGGTSPCYTSANPYDGREESAAPNLACRRMTAATPGHIFARVSEESESCKIEVHDRLWTLSSNALSPQSVEELRWEWTGCRHP